MFFRYFFSLLTILSALPLVRASSFRGVSEDDFLIQEISGGWSEKVVFRLSGNAGQFLVRQTTLSTVEIVDEDLNSVMGFAKKKLGSSVISFYDPDSNLRGKLHSNKSEISYQDSNGSELYRGSKVRTNNSVSYSITEADYNKWIGEMKCSIEEGRQQCHMYLDKHYRDGFLIDAKTLVTRAVFDRLNTYRFNRNLTFGGITVGAGLLGSAFIYKRSVAHSVKPGQAFASPSPVASSQTGPDKTGLPLVVKTGPNDKNSSSQPNQIPPQLTANPGSSVGPTGSIPSRPNGLLDQIQKLSDFVFSDAGDDALTNPLPHVKFDPTRLPHRAKPLGVKPVQLPVVPLDQKIKRAQLTENVLIIVGSAPVVGKITDIDTVNSEVWIQSSVGETPLPYGFSDVLPVLDSSDHSYAGLTDTIAYREGGSPQIGKVSRAFGHYPNLNGSDLWIEVRSASGDRNLLFKKDKIGIKYKALPSELISGVAFDASPGEWSTYSVDRAFSDGTLSLRSISGMPSTVTQRSRVGLRVSDPSLRLFTEVLFLKDGEPAFGQVSEVFSNGMVLIEKPDSTQILVRKSELHRQVPMSQLGLAKKDVDFVHPFTLHAMKGQIERAYGNGFVVVSTNGGRTTYTLAAKDLAESKSVLSLDQEIQAAHLTKRVLAFSGKDDLPVVGRIFTFSNGQFGMLASGRVLKFPPEDLYAEVNLSTLGRSQNEEVAVQSKNKTLAGVVRGRIQHAFVQSSGGNLQQVWYEILDQDGKSEVWSATEVYYEVSGSKLIGQKVSYKIGVQKEVKILKEFSNGSLVVEYDDFGLKTPLIINSGHYATEVPASRLGFTSMDVEVNYLGVSWFRGKIVRAYEDGLVIVRILSSQRDFAFPKSKIRMIQDRSSQDAPAAKPSELNFDLIDLPAGRVFNESQKELQEKFERLQSIGKILNGSIKFGKLKQDSGVTECVVELANFSIKEGSQTFDPKNLSASELKRLALVMKRLFINIHPDKNQDDEVIKTLATDIFKVVDPCYKRVLDIAS